MPGRLVVSSLAADDTLTLDGHGFETDDVVYVRAAEGGTLSAPLAEGTAYYVIRLNDSAFKLSSSEGGAAINLSTNGESMVVSTALPVDDVLEYYSRFVDDYVPAHAVPLEAPYPVTIVATVAELAAKKLMSIAGQTSAAVSEAEERATKRLERWAAGVPIRDAAVTTAATNKAVTSTLVGGTDPRGYGSEVLP